MSNATDPIVKDDKRELGKLFRHARLYGKVCIFTHDDSRYNCTIEFITSKGATLKASSGHDNETPEDAMAKAIKEAEKIVDGMESSATKIRSKVKKFIGGI